MKRLFNKFLPVVMLIVCSILGTTDAWAAKVTFTAKTAVYNGTGGTAKVELFQGTTSKKSAETTKSTLVSASFSDGSDGFFGIGAKDPANTKATYTATPNTGYYFVGWFAAAACTGTPTQSVNPYTTPETKKADGIGTLYARFNPFEFGEATPSNVLIDNAYAKHTYEGSVVIATVGATSVSDFNTPTLVTNSGSGTFSIVNQTWAGGNLTINYRFNANGFVGTTTATLTAKTAGDVKTKDITLTATTVAPTIISGDAGAQLTPSTPTALAEGTATFNVTNAEDASYFATPTFTNVQGGGTWKVVSTSYAAGVYTVNYTFQSDAEHLGDHSADLTLTATVGSATKTVTATAFTEAIATDDAKVTSSTGTLIYQGDWATALSKANTTANASCTLTLLRNVDVTTQQNVTNTFTLDLNGKKLSNTNLGDAPTNILYIDKSGQTLTIKDSKSGGEIHGVGSRNNPLYAVYVNNGHLILDGGKLYIENTMVYVKDVTGKVEADAVRAAAKMTITMNGGEIEAVADRNAIGLRNNGSGSDTSNGITINGGSIYAHASKTTGQYAYGIFNYGKLTVNGGTIEGHADLGYGYGIYTQVSANATQTSNYAGTTIINDGVVTGSSDATYAYGVYANATMATNATSATDGTLSNKASARLTVNGGRIVANSTGRYCYGVVVLGDYNSYNPDTKTDGHWTTVLRDAVVEATGSRDVYGIQASTTTSSATGTEVNGDVELYNMNVTARTTTSTGAYAAWSVATSRTITSTASGYYPGEYASQGGKLTIYSGNYKAYSGASSAYAVGSSTRSRTVAGNASGYSTLIIHGGDFFAETTTTEARAICSGGWTTVDGGTFTAHAKTTTARGAMVVSGKTILNNVSFDVLAETGSAFGLCAWADVADKTLVTNAGELVANNVTVVAKTNSGNTAEGVRVHTARKALETVDAGYVPGDFTISAKATINGGSYTAIAAGTTAYGINSVVCPNLDVTPNPSWPELEVHDATFTATTKGTTSAYGARIGGPTIIDNCTFNVAAQTETAYGLLVDHKKTTVSNSTFNVSATTKAYGIYANAAVADKTGYATAAEVESTNNTYTVNATATTTAEGVYLHSISRAITKTETGYTPGDYAAAATISINGDTYNVTAATTTAYGIYLKGMAQPTETSEVNATTTCQIEDVKIKTTATSTFADVLVYNGDTKTYFPPLTQPLVIKHGLFLNQTDLSFYTADGKVVHTLKSGDEGYSDGYKYDIDGVRYGDPVCKNGSKQYNTLEEALDDVNSGKVNGGTIEMLLPYTLPAGNYILPKGCTLLIPYKANQGDAIGDKSSNLNHDPRITNPTTWTPAYCFRKLTFESGVNMQVYGAIEASAQQHCLTGSNNGTNGATASVNGPYGELHLDEGSSITLNTDPSDRTKGGVLRAWGYVTGKGEITAQRGATVREMFQVSDWKGGNELSDNGFGSGSTCHRVFPVNQYYIQNIQAPTIYRPGSHLKTSFHMTAKVLWVEIYGSDDVNIVGEYRSASDKDVAMFLMNTATDDKDTWVRKEFDAENDVQVYTVSSAAYLSAMTIPTGGLTGDITSSDYDLPITQNMKILVDNGVLEVTENIVMLPGSEIEIMHDATLKINSGKHLSLYDNAEWSTYAYSGKYTQTVPYCPEWKASPRQNTLSAQKDAALNVHGTVLVEGFLFTTAGGANIYSNNKDAGHVIFPSSIPAGVQSGVTVSQWKSTGFVDADYTSAKLRNEGDEDFTGTDGAANGKDYCYSEGQWQCWEQVGCFQVDKSDDANWKWYGQPSDFVQLKPNTDDNKTAPVLDEDHLYPNVDETRFCILLDDCMWREVSLVDDGLVYCEDKDTYYEWNSTLNQWEEKYFTITWKNEDGSVLNTYNFVKYNTMPKWLSATPTKARETGDPAGSYWNFTGWTPDFDYVKSNQEYTAVFELIVPKYDVLWMNEDGSKTLHISRWAEGEHPVYDGAEIKKATSMEGVDLAHNGWSTAANGAGTRYGLTDELPAMGAAAQTYYATFAEGYIITWKNEDGTVFDRKLWAAGTRPTHANINKESDAQYDYVFAGWTPEVLPVEADAEYTAVFTPILRQYAITFSNLNGKGSSQVVNVNYGATPVCPVTPDRGNSAEYSYEWTGWKDAAGNTFGTDYVFPAVLGDATYTATFSQTTRTYTVTWKNEDGSVLERVRGLAVGDAVPDYSGATPEKEPTRYLVYGFTGWTPAKKATIDESGDQEYRATYDAGSTRYYTVRWLMDNGDLIDESHLEYDQMPTHTDPTKASTALYSYDFAGWTPAISAVKGDAEYKATFNAIHRQYEITYILYDDVKNVVRYQADDAVAVPTDPTREGYTFAGWDKPIPATMPAEDMTITANWTINQYTVTFKNGEDVVKSGDCDYASVIVAPADPEKTGYTFSGWYNGENKFVAGATVPVGGITYEAHWTINKYTITFANIDGNGGASEVEYEYGATPSYDCTPAKAEDAQYTYTFSGWKDDNSVEYSKDAALPEVGDADVTYTAQFTSTPKSYTLAWDLNGGTVKTAGTAAGSVAYTTELVAPVVEKTGYTFNGWDPTVPATMPAANATYTAQWRANTFTITWLNYDGETLASSTMSFGEIPSYDGETPTRPDDANYTYEFAGWNKEIAIVTGDDTYTAQFNATEKSQTITNIVAGDGDHATSSEPVEIEVQTTAETVTIKEDGEIVINEGATLTVTNDFVLTADAANADDFADERNLPEQAGASGQVIFSGSANESDALKTQANVYFDLNINIAARTWYAVSVPWQVDANTGIAIGTNTLRLGIDEDITYYDGAARAKYGPVTAYTVKYLEDLSADKQVLQPGTMYFLYFATNWPNATIRFTKKTNTSTVYTGDVKVAEYASSTGSDGGWNGISNPKIYSAYVNAGVTDGYVFVGGEYKRITLADTKFAVGTPVMVQVEEDKTVVINRTQFDPATAPARARALDPIKIDVFISGEDGRAADRLTIKAIEDEKEDKYVIGQDLAKMSVSTKKAQLWVDRYKNELTVNTQTLKDNVATYPLVLSVPSEGDYTIDIRETTDENVYLTYNGKVIWNLSSSPYTLPLAKGKTAGYGLRVVAGREIVTSIDEAAANARGEARKVMVDGILYILRGDKVFDANGKEL